MWISGKTEKGKKLNEWIELELARPAELQAIKITGREWHGPKAGHVLVATGGGDYRKVAEFTCEVKVPTVISFEPSQVDRVKLVFTDAYDPQRRDPQSVQIHGIALYDRHGARIDTPVSPRFKDFPVKAAYSEGGIRAPDMRYLLDQPEELPGEDVVRTADIVDITDRLGSDKVLRWDVPEGKWTHISVIGG